MSYTPKNNFNLQIGKTGIGKKGFRKKILADVACCDNLKGYEYYGGFPLETSLEFSRDMAVHGGCPNFSWEVIDSVYFTFAHATTEGRTNTVNADPATPIDAEELAIVEDNCGHKLVFVILYCGGGISIIPYPPIIPDPPDDPPYDPPWPPSGGGRSCNCGDIEIGYTTQQMMAGEFQVLTVENGLLGCTYEYKWEIISGEGTLSADFGVSVTYTAPRLNPGCINNPIITLSIGEELCDALHIAVNIYVGGPAYFINTCRYDWFCDGCDELCPVVDVNTYNCDDAWAVFQGYCGGGSTSSGACDLPCTFCASLNRNSCAQVSVDGPCPQPLYQGTLDDAHDIRTPSMIAAGCCPARLL